MSKCTCENCKIVNELINGPSHGDYIGNIKIINGILELYASDYLIENILGHLDKQDRYSLNQYFRCNNCNRYYFIGICFYGLYIFKEKSSSEIDSINFNKIFDGCDKIGSFFNSSINY